MDAHGYPPTVREIGEQVGLASPSTVHAHLANLERAGLIKRDPTKPRALELTGRAAAREPRRRRERPRAAAARADRRRRPAARRAERRRLHLRARAALQGRGGVPAPRPRRLDAGRRASSTATTSSCSASRTPATARSSSRSPATTRSADEATVKRFFREKRAGPPAARERRLRADLRRARPDPRQGDRGVPDAVTVASLHRSLDQELVAILRRASLECPVCSEFLLHRSDGIGCPSVGSSCKSRRRPPCG